MTMKIEFDTDAPVFRAHEEALATECSWILRHIAHCVANGQTKNKVVTHDGDIIGNWEIKEETP